MTIGPAIGHMHHVRIRCVNVSFARGSVFLLRIAMDVSDEASSEVEPSNVASSEVEPSNVASSEVEPSDVASSEVEPVTHTGETGLLRHL